MIDTDNVHDLFDYDPIDGTFRWKISPSRKVRAGDICGYPHPQDWLIVYRRRNYSGRRLAWLFMTGEWPAHDVRNADGDVTSLRWENIIPSDVQERALRSAKVSASSGHRNVFVRRGRYQAFIRRKKRVLIDRSFDTLEEAIAARDAVLNREGRDQNHGR